MNSLQRQVDLLKATCLDLKKQVDRLSRPPKNSWIGKAGGGEAGRFVLTTDPADGTTGATGDYMTATADIYKAEDDGSVTLLVADVTLYLDYEMFADLRDGDYGQAVKDARGKWIAVNAPCAEEY